MRRIFIAFQVLLVVTAVLAGAAAGYALKPTSVVQVTASQGGSYDDSCLFANGHKIGC